MQKIIHLHEFEYDALKRTAEYKNEEIERRAYELFLNKSPYCIDVLISSEQDKYGDVRFYATSWVEGIKEAGLTQAEKHRIGKYIKHKIESEIEHKYGYAIENLNEKLDEKRTLKRRKKFVLYQSIAFAVQTLLLIANILIMIKYL